MTRLYAFVGIYFFFVALGFNQLVAQMPIQLNDPSASDSKNQSTTIKPTWVQGELFASGFAPATGIAFDKNGNFFAANYREAGTIGKVSTDGSATIFCTLEQIAPLEGREPLASGIRVDAVGRLLVADEGGGRLLRINATGTQAEVLADRYNGNRFQAITAVALDLAGNIYFSDLKVPGKAKSGSIFIYNIATKKVSQLATGIDAPHGLAVSKDQKTLYISESGRFQISQIALPVPAKKLAQVEVLLTLSPPPLLKKTEKKAAKQPAPQTTPKEQSLPLETKQQASKKISTVAPQTAPSPNTEIPSDEMVPPGIVPAGMIIDQQDRLYVCIANQGLLFQIDPKQKKLLKKFHVGKDGLHDCHFKGSKLYFSSPAKEAVHQLKLKTPGFIYSKPPVIPHHLKQPLIPVP